VSTLGLAADPGGPIEVSTVTVNGEPATQWLTPGEGIDLEWQRDGQWFLARTDGTVSADDLRRFAEGMTPGRTMNERVLPISDVTAFAVPDGFDLYSWDRFGVCAANGDRSVSLCVALLEEGAVSLPTTADLTINEDPAYVNRPRDDGRTRAS
jgi:hypothetical protein